MPITGQKSTVSSVVIKNVVVIGVSLVYTPDGAAYAVYCSGYRITIQGSIFYEGKVKTMADKREPKLTITNPDGSTENPEVFIAVVARGLIPIGKEGERILYMAEEGFSVGIMCSIAASQEVVAALLEGLLRIAAGIIDTARDDPGALFEMLQTLESLRSKRTVVYEEKGIIRRKPGEN